MHILQSLHQNLTHTFHGYFIGSVEIMVLPQTFDPVPIKKHWLT